MQEIGEIAKVAHVDEKYLERYGRYKAKVDLSLLKESKKEGKLVLVTAITPTPAGEGKTTCTIGLVDGLNKIDGVYSPIPMGAFYTVVRLPIDDSDRFCEWCLSEFEYEGATIMLAPASGFYSDSELGKDEVRIAYVLDKNDLKKALTILSKALEAYPGRTTNR